MAIISGVTVDWGLSPRLINIPATETEVSLGDLQDTLQDLEDDETGMPFPKLRSASGGQDLGGGESVGLTMQLQDAQLAFEARVTPLEEGTETTGGSSTVLTDTTALFETNLVGRGDLVYNVTDGSQSTVLSVESETSLTSTALVGGATNLYNSSDAYAVYDVVQCNISGGNLVAIDDVGAAIGTVFPTFGTQVVRTSSSSATALSQQDLLFAGAIWIDSDDGNDTNTGSQQDPVATIAQGLVIGAAKNIKNYKLRGTLTFASDPPASEWDGFGGGAGLVLMPGTDLSKTAWSGMEIVGAVSGDMGMVSGDIAVQFSRCGFGTYTFSNLHGFITDCAFDNTTFVPIAAKSFVIAGCSGQTAGATPSLIIDGTDGAIDCSVRDFSGGIQVKNVTSASAVMTVGVSEGEITLDSTCTDGTIICRGVGELTDNSNGATVINQMVGIPTMRVEAQSAAAAFS